VPPDALPQLAALLDVLLQLAVLPQPLQPLQPLAYGSLPG